MRGEVLCIISSIFYSVAQYKHLVMVTKNNTPSIPFSFFNNGINIQLHPCSKVRNQTKLLQKVLTLTFKADSQKKTENQFAILHIMGHP